MKPLPYPLERLAGAFTPVKAVCMGIAQARSVPPAGQDMMPPSRRTVRKARQAQGSHQARHACSKTRPCRLATNSCRVCAYTTAQRALMTCVALQLTTRMALQYKASQSKAERYSPALICGISLVFLLLPKGGDPRRRGGGALGGLKSTRRPTRCTRAAMRSRSASCT